MKRFEDYFMNTVEADVLEARIENNNVIIKYKNPLSGETDELITSKNTDLIKRLYVRNRFASVEDYIENIETIKIKVDDDGETNRIVIPQNPVIRLYMAYLEAPYMFSESNKQDLTFKGIISLITSALLISVLLTLFIVLLNDLNVSQLFGVILIAYSIYILIGIDIKLAVLKAIKKLKQLL